MGTAFATGNDAISTRVIAVPVTADDGDTIVMTLQLLTVLR